MRATAQQVTSPPVPMPVPVAMGGDSGVDGSSALFAAVRLPERRRCSDCMHLQRKGYCAMAQKGLMPGVTPWFTPAPNVLQHCHFFHPAALELGAP